MSFTMQELYDGAVDALKRRGIPDFILDGPRQKFYVVAQSTVLVWKKGEWTEQPERLLEVEAANAVAAQYIVMHLNMRVIKVFDKVEALGAGK